MDGARRQDSLGVSSSVAEGVLTPAALHLRVSAEVERQKGRGGGEVNGPRCHRLHFRPVIESPPQLPCQPTFSQPPNIIPTAERW